MLMELTTPLPWMHFRPFSMMLHFDESIMIGTREMSGSEAIRFRKVTMASSPSSRPSSMLTSIICAPLSTCCRATIRALSYSPFRIIFLNSAEPVTLVRSPTLTNSESAAMFIGSRPARRHLISTSGICRGGNFATASAMALMCAGVVPQQPPMMLRKPDCAHSAISFAIASGDSSYSPNSLGRPALGCALT